MPQVSTHLDYITNKQNRVANLQIVFADIVKYSQRRTQNQTSVIDKFTECLRKAIMETSKEFTEYAQRNNINFQTDIILIPTGDGAAIVFSFEGLHNIHLFFAKRLLFEVYTENKNNACERYSNLSWCNCHTNLDLRIGISEGKGIIYRDINNLYNVAGNVINMAARVMNIGDGGNIIFTEDAYKQIIDMDSNPNLADSFVNHHPIKVKHDLEINVFQYIDESDFINSGSPKDIIILQKFEAAQQNFDSAFKKFGIGDSSLFNSNKSMEDKVELYEDMAGSLDALGGIFSKFLKRPENLEEKTIEIDTNRNADEDK